MGQYSQTSFQTDPKCFQKVASENYLVEFSTNWLSNWYLQTCVTQQWLRLWAWFFAIQFRFSPRGAFWPYHRTCNAFFMDLPVPSHSSLLTTKSVNFVVGMWWVPFVMEIIIFIVVTLIAEVLFNSCWFVLLYNGLNIAGNKVTSFQTIIDVHKWGMQCHCFDVVCVQSYQARLFFFCHLVRKEYSLA